MDFTFFFNSILLGVGLAMDAFSVSLANGLSEPCMPRKKPFIISGIFSIFQLAMPLIGWVCVTTVARLFGAFEKFIPWIALALLSYIGIKMIIEGIKIKECCEEREPARLSGILVQGIATSIDALSVGFTISEYDFSKAFLSCLIIGIVTFFICYLGVMLGKRAGGHFSGNRASILGGAILVFIGIEIFVTSFF